MTRLSLKPDSSFFRKISIGAVGARSVVSDLSGHGHRIAELERGSTDTKLWKDVKRKQVRIPDLVCARCGVRIESRAKTKRNLSMAHSPTNGARAWDYGMVGSDMVAFPICEATDEAYWSLGKLDRGESYWRERSWVNWHLQGTINYFRVASFRSTPPHASYVKGATEGPETSISWNATFSTRYGVVERVDDRKVRIRRNSDGHRHTWTIPSDQRIFVQIGEEVQVGQVIAASVDVMIPKELQCHREINGVQIAKLLESRERTQRFTGIKLARLRRDRAHSVAVDDLASDSEEDVYTRLEGASYLASVCGLSAETLFRQYLDTTDEQIRLEAVISLGETHTEESISILASILQNTDQPYYLRSAAAWALSQNNTQRAWDVLIRAFRDVEQGIREEALDGLISIGRPAIHLLLEGLEHRDNDQAAGCAEALRQLQPLSADALDRLTRNLGADSSPWTVWLLGNLPKELVAPSVAYLQDSAPQLQYAMSILWTFAGSWVAKNWELNVHSGAASSEEH